MSLYFLGNNILLGILTALSHIVLDVKIRDQGLLVNPGNTCLRGENLVKTISSSFLICPFNSCVLFIRGLFCICALSHSSFPQTAFLVVITQLIWGKRQWRVGVSLFACYVHAAAGPLHRLKRKVFQTVFNASGWY